MIAVPNPAMDPALAKPWITYVGFCDPNGAVRVVVCGRGRVPRELSLRASLKVIDHSPTGFGYGYAGSGPAQLALAILLDHLHDKDRAIRYHQTFKYEMIANLPRDEQAFVIHGTAIDNWIRLHESVREAADMLSNQAQSEGFRDK